MQTGLEQIRAIRQAEKKKQRKRRLFVLVVVIVIAVLYLCIQGRGVRIYDPLYVGRCFAAFLRIKFLSIGASSAVKSELLAQNYAVLGNGYGVIIARLQNLLLMLLSGAVLALSGTVYQTSMRNPMAVPTMLGVSSGVNLAQLLLVIEYGSAVYQLTTTRYIYNYGISIAILLIVLLGGKIAGGKRASVADMLVVGTVVNRLINIVVNYLRTELDTETLTLLQEYSESSYNTYNQFYNLGILVGVSLLLLLPIFLMRFSYNAASFEDGDATSLGVCPGAMRVYGLVAGALLTTTAMLHCGNVGVMALIVPHLCRYLFGADFRRLCWGSAAGGALLMLVAEIISGFVYFEDYQIPIGNIVSLAALPVMVWVMLRERRGWE